MCNLKCCNHMARKGVPEKYRKWFLRMANTMKNCRECNLENVELEVD